MQTRIITVSRMFGSGGRTISKEIAQQLGYAYYDREIVDSIARKSGLSPEFIERSGEYAASSNSLLYSIAMGLSANGGAVSLADQVFALQSDFIREAADKSPCVIVGRCADFLLSERKDCLHVLFYAPAAYRAERIVRVYGEKTDAPEKRLKDVDERRRLYYRHYAGRAWGQMENYHMALDTAAVGEKACADMVVSLVRAGCPLRA